MAYNIATQAWVALAYKCQLHIATDSVHMWGKKHIQALLHKKCMGRSAIIAALFWNPVHEVLSVKVATSSVYKLHTIILHPHKIVK